MKRLNLLFALVISFSVPGGFALAVSSETAQDSSPEQATQAQTDGPGTGVTQSAQVEDEFDENSPIKISDYFPGKVGSEWTFSNSCGGTLSAKITRIEKICNVDSFCIEAFESECPALRKSKSRTAKDPQKTPVPDKMCVALDDSGLWMVRYVHSTGAYNSYCPPTKILPAVVELGDRVEYAHEDTPCIEPNGELCGMLDGEGEYWFRDYEDVTVPAGFFPHCLHIIREYEFETSSGSKYSITEETWNARGVGQVKRYYKKEIFMRRAEGNDQTSEREELYLLEKYRIPK